MTRWSTLLDEVNCFLFLTAESEQVSYHHNEERSDESSPDCNDDTSDLPEECVWIEVSITDGGESDDS